MTLDLPPEGRWHPDADLDRHHFAKGKSTGSITLEASERWSKFGFPDGNPFHIDRPDGGPLLDEVEDLDPLGKESPIFLSNDAASPSTS